MLYVIQLLQWQPMHILIIQMMMVMFCGQSCRLWYPASCVLHMLRSHLLPALHSAGLLLLQAQTLAVVGA
jgi:hypothetical protein